MTFSDALLDYFSCYLYKDSEHANTPSIVRVKVQFLIPRIKTSSVEAAMN